MFASLTTLQSEEHQEMRDKRDEMNRGVLETWLTEGQGHVRSYQAREHNEISRSQTAICGAFAGHLVLALLCFQMLSH